MNKEIPVLVRIVAFLHYFGAVISVIIGLGILVLGTKFFSDFSAGSLTSFLLCLVGAVVGYALGSGLSKGKNWARIIQIVIYAFGVIFGVVKILNGVNITIMVVSVIVSILLASYFAFNKKVKVFFN